MKMNKLMLGQKVTILNTEDLVPSFYKGTIQSFYYSNYAQYDNALFIYLKRFRSKRIDRIIISPVDTVFIFDGFKWDSAWRKEVLSTDNNITRTELHRWKYNDLKDNKDLIYSHAFNEEFEGIKTDNECFIDMTCDFICENDIKPLDAQENISYINYIKCLVSNYNVNNLMKFVKAEGFNILENCLTLATEYSW